MRILTKRLASVGLFLFVLAASMGPASANGQTATSGPLYVEVLSATPGKIGEIGPVGGPMFGRSTDVDGVRVVMRITNRGQIPLVDGFLFTTTWLKSDGKLAFPDIIPRAGVLLLGDASVRGTPIKIPGTLAPGSSIRVEFGMPASLQSFSHFTLRIKFLRDLLAARCQDEINGDAPGPADPRCAQKVAAYFQALARQPRTVYDWREAPWLSEIPDMKVAYAKVIGVGQAQTEINPSLRGRTDAYALSADARRTYPNIVGNKPVVVNISLLCTAPGGPPSSNNGTSILVGMYGMEITELEEFKGGTIKLWWGMTDRGVRFLMASPANGAPECS